MYVAIQAATVAVIAMREADKWPIPGRNTANVEESHKPWHGRPALRQPSFNMKTPNQYVELLGFDREVTNTANENIQAK